MFGEGDDIRDHVYVDDVAAITAALAASDATGVFNVASGESRDFGSIAARLQVLSPKPFELVKLPKSGGTSRREFDISRLREALPDLKVTPFEDGLKATVEARLGGVK
jgi:UDP-glucose 4-epimerase